MRNFVDRTVLAGDWRVLCSMDPWIVAVSKTDGMGLRSEAFVELMKLV
jgi:hypothetical protein